MKKLKTRNHKYYGWTPDIPDQRDLILSLPKKMKKLPTKVDLRKEQIPIFNQGALGSCTANAISAAYIHNLIKQNENIFIPSRLFIYYNERAMIGTINQDSGAMLRDGIKSLNSIGVCDEKLWPYVIPAFTKKPLDKCYTDAKRNKAVVYQRVPRNLYDFKNCLASGLPFVGGFAVYESFESGEIAKTGKMSMPKQDEQFMGGHAILVVGYDDDMKCFIVRNSWGSDWGDKGYFYMPYEYLLNDNLSDDFWVIQQVTDPDIVITDINIYNKKPSLMEDVKSWIQSKTIWAILVALAPFLTIKLGFDMNQTLADILQIAGLVGAVIFRITATKKIGV